MDAVIMDMLRQTSKRIDKTARLIPEGKLAAPATLSPNRGKSQQKKELMERLKSLEGSIETERKLREEAEDKLAGLRKAA